MYEYTFTGGNMHDTYFATTYDFIQFCADVTKHFDSKTAGAFIQSLFAAHHDKLDFIRVTDWNFKIEWQDNQVGPEPWVTKSIKLRKVA